MLHSSYLGTAPLLFGLLGLLWPRTRRSVVFWLALALGGAVLSFGEVGCINSHYGNWRLPLPYALLTPFPPFDTWGSVWRMSIIGILSLTVTIGVVLQACWRRGPRALTLAAALAVVGLALLDAVALAGAPYPMQTANATPPSVYDTISSSQEQGAVVPLPAGQWDSYRCLPRPGHSCMDYWNDFFFMYQHRHWRPLPVVPDPTRSSAFNQIALLREVARLQQVESLLTPAVIGEKDLAVSLLQLKEAGFVWVVLHSKMMRPDLAGRLGMFLDSTLSLVSTAQDGTRLYKVP